MTTHEPTQRIQKHSRDFIIQPQPDYTSCGPTCLHGIYGFYGDDVDLSKLQDEIHTLEGGGTLAVFLACHALRKGYRARIYTYNLHVFDPTWFIHSRSWLRGRLEQQLALRTDPRQRLSTQAYMDFLDLGGEIFLEDLTPALLRRFLDKGKPILTGLSSTFLYRAMREYGDNLDDDDLRGEPQGHFVVLCEYDREDKTVLVADPLLPNDYAGEEQYYYVDISRLVCSILLGVMTYDANFLVLEPALKERKKTARYAHPADRP